MHFFVGTTFSYYAVANTTYTSNTIQIPVIGGSTQEQQNPTKEAEQNSQNNIFGAEGFDEEIDERAALAGDVLSENAEMDLIEENSLNYNEETQSYTATYNSGVLIDNIRLR